MIRRRRQASGQALAEFAMVVPIFLLMLFGIIDLSRVVYTANAMSNGAREGARAGSVANRPPECMGPSRKICAESVAKSHAWGLPAEDIGAETQCERWAPGATSFTLIPNADLCRSGDTLRVHTTMTIELLTPLAGQLIGPFEVTGDSAVAVQQ